MLETPSPRDTKNISAGDNIPFPHKTRLLYTMEPQPGDTKEIPETPSQMLVTVHSRGYEKLSPRGIIFDPRKNAFRANETLTRGLDRKKS